MSESLQTSSILAQTLDGGATQETLPIVAADGARSELLLVRPAGATDKLMYWLPAMGMPARHYLPLAHALASRGIAVALHEWRGIGSSDHRAGRHSDWSYRHLLVDDIPAGMAAVRMHCPQMSCWLGGHSLGGQLACLYTSLHPEQHAGIVVIASGAPYWRIFRFGPLLWVTYALAPWLARAVGYLPGRRIGFAGNEARGLITDWALTGRTGRYAAKGIDDDFERRLATLKLPVLGMRLSHDWMAPPASLEWLLGKMPAATRTTELITPAVLGSKQADHFSWMKTPDPIAERIRAWADA